MDGVWGNFSSEKLIMSKLKLGAIYETNIYKFG